MTNIRYLPGAVPQYEIVADLSDGDTINGFSIVIARQKNKEGLKVLLSGEGQIYVLASFLDDKFNDAVARKMAEVAWSALNFFWMALPDEGDAA
jgi:hypothetical protein